MKAFIFVIALSILIKVCTCDFCSSNLNKNCVNSKNGMVCTYWYNDQCNIWQMGSNIFLTEMVWTFGGSSSFTSIDNNAFIDFPALIILKFEEKGSIKNNLKRYNFDQGLKNLTNLQLKYNNINSIPMYCFTNLTKLDYLDLKYNNIQTYEDNNFPSLLYQVLITSSVTPCSPMKFSLKCAQYVYHDYSKIQEINWSYGSPHGTFTSMADYSFSGYINLRSLTISDYLILENRLKSQLIFAGIPMLNTLAMPLSGITSLYANIFSKLNKLTFLDLSRNLINTLEDSAFAGLGNLLTIKLWSNNIKSLQANIFSQSKKLLEIDLSQNNIQNVDQNAFSGLSSLTNLDLNTNNLKDDTLPNYIFQSIINSFTVRLYGNSFKDAFQVNKELFKFQNITVIIQKYPDPVPNDFKKCFNGNNNAFFSFDLTKSETFCCKTYWTKCCKHDGHCNTDNECCEESYCKHYGKGGNYCQQR